MRKITQLLFEIILNTTVAVKIIIAKIKAIGSNDRECLLESRG